MIYREARVPAWAAGLAAFVCFCLLFCIAFFPEGPLLYHSYYPPLFLASVVCSYLVSHKLSCTLRWRTFEDDTPRCTSCNYNLTGNVTGICPECGEPL